MSDQPNTILLKGSPLQKEGNAGAEIMPGHLLDHDANDELIPHGTESVNACPIFAYENSEIGKGIDDAYAEDERVVYHYYRPGDEAQAWLDVGESVNKHDELESAGNGALKAHVKQADLGEGEDIETKAIVCRALEEIDNSAGEEPVRIQVEVI